MLRLSYLVVFFVLGIKTGYAARSIELSPISFGDYVQADNPDTPLPPTGMLVRQFDFTISNVGAVSQTVTVTLTATGGLFFSDLTNPPAKTNSLSPFLSNYTTEVAIPAAGSATQSQSGSIAAGAAVRWPIVVRFKGKSIVPSGGGPTAAYSFGGVLTPKITIAENAGAITASIQSHLEWAGLVNPPLLSPFITSMRSYWRDIAVLNGRPF